MTRADAAGGTTALDAESNDFRAVTEIVITAPDHPGLFSKLAGAISASGGSIVDSKIFTTTDGFALDVFSVQDAQGGPFGDAARVGRLDAAIARTLRGETQLGRKSAPPKPRAAAFGVRPRIRFDNEASILATVIEVEGLDRPGLLYDVTQALFQSGLSISSAIVSTYGERAMDVFYVRDGFGHKIVHPDRLKSVEARLVAALEDTAPDGPLEAASALGA
jgi:[protein-PII] uridylyltransferase